MSRKDHLEPVRAKVRAAPIASPQLPWSLTGTIAVGGLTEVGFAESSEASEFLLVLSHQGRSVIDCAIGEKIARDRSDDRRSWYAQHILLAKGIGPLEGQSVRLSGLYGGGLPQWTNDMWRVQSLAIDWPKCSLLLLPPEPKDIYFADANFVKLAAESEVRAFGFSYSGKTLIIATSSDLTVFGRP
jgi:hypothetical protein